MLNHYTAIGRLIKDPVLYETGSKQPFCPFRIAVDRDYKNSDGKYEADYINCTIWGSGAKIIAERFRKGSRICIEGRLQTRKYEKDGKKKDITEVIVSTFYFVDQKSDSSSLNKGQRLEPDAEPEETLDDYAEAYGDIEPEPEP